MLDELQTTSNQALMKLSTAKDKAINRTEVDASLEVDGFTVPEDVANATEGPIFKLKSISAEGAQIATNMTSKCNDGNEQILKDIEEKAAQILADITTNTVKAIATLTTDADKDWKQRAEAARTVKSGPTKAASYIHWRERH